MRYVQHTSGQGNKYEVTEAPCDACWHSHDKDLGVTFYLPKSEFREVPAPERWKDITEIISENEIIFRWPVGGEGYRLRKVSLWKRVPIGTGKIASDYEIQDAFIVEKLEP